MTPKHLIQLLALALLIGCTAPSATAPPSGWSIVRGEDGWRFVDDEDYISIRAFATERQAVSYAWFFHHRMEGSKHRCHE